MLHIAIVQIHSFVLADISHIVHYNAIKTGRMSKLEWFAEYFTWISQSFITFNLRL